MRELNEAEVEDVTGAGPLLAFIRGVASQTFQAGVALGEKLHDAVCDH